MAVKIRVPFWVPKRMRHTQKRDPNFDNHPYESLKGRLLGVQVESLSIVHPETLIFTWAFIDLLSQGIYRVQRLVGFRGLGFRSQG